MGHEFDVLVVGAGPTGLALAAQLRMFGIRFRLIDRARDRARESRALAVQARTLEILQTFGLGERLVARGNTSVKLALHLEGRLIASGQLGDINADDTRFPFILFVSQVETEAVLNEHLTRAGVTVERGVELVTFEPGQRDVLCVLRHDDGRQERLHAAFLVGCDGAHSAVRKRAGIPFEGGSYPQDFVLGDVEADGALEPDAINSFAGAGGVAMFFPLGRPTTWRVIAMGPANRAAMPGIDGTLDEGLTSPLTLAELQQIVRVPTSGSVTVRDPAWLTHFHLHHRQVAHYRAGRVFLAGDAAHIHSPVGAQGMNTGIQDAWNLGWKLALVVQGRADPRLLDTYEAERWPVGRFLLRYTDRIFGIFTTAISAGVAAGWVRRAIAPWLLPRVFASRRLRAGGFRFVSELDIRYRRSPAVVEGRPRLRGGPKAGDRLPDLRLTRNGRTTSLQREVVGPHLALLLCGDLPQWDPDRIIALVARYERLHVVNLSTHAAADALVDDSGEALARLGAASKTAQYLVRPDGHVAFRCAGRDSGKLEQYLEQWYPAGAREA